MNKDQEVNWNPVKSIPKKWEFKKLKDISLDFIGGGTPSTANPKYWNGNIAWMTSAHITGREVLTGQRYITNKGLENSSAQIVPKNNLLVATRVGIGKATINRIDMAISQDLTGVLIDRNKAIPDFIYWNLIKHENRLKSLAQGSTIKGILREELGKLEFSLPPLMEQKKIAKILSTVDQAIEKVGEAIDKTLRLKKGLMQELLTKGIGHKEFKETELGRIPKKWELKKLEEISLDFVSGGTPSTSNKKYWNGDIAWMTSAFITEREITAGQRYITKEGLNNSATNIVPKDNLTVATRVGIGKAAINRVDIAISQDLTGVIIDKKQAHPDFLYWVIINNENRLKALAQGSTIKGILRGGLGGIKLALPSLLEQQRIAEILGSVDGRLEALRNKKEKLNKVKKGLMEDLLTGKVRVTKLIEKEA
jgi:type I restriction enzyme S subunit